MNIVIEYTTDNQIQSENQKAILKIQSKFSERLRNYSPVTNYFAAGHINSGCFHLGLFYSEIPVGSSSG